MARGLRLFHISRVWDRCKAFRGPGQDEASQGMGSAYTPGPVSLPSGERLEAEGGFDAREADLGLARLVGPERGWVSVRVMASFGEESRARFAVKWQPLRRRRVGGGRY